MSEKKPTNLKELLEKIKKMNGCRKNVNCSDQACIDCAGYWVVELKQSRREYINSLLCKKDNKGDTEKCNYCDSCANSWRIRENLDIIGGSK